MRKLILYLLTKYHGTWDVIYDVISGPKEKVNLDEVKSMNFELNGKKYMAIIEDLYPLKLKQIYMPPFALFWNDNFDYIQKNVLGIAGSFNRREYQEIINRLPEDDVICINNDELSEYFYNLCVESKVKLIVICDKSIDNFKFKNTKYGNILIIAENNDAENTINSPDQSIERLIYGFSDHLLVSKINDRKLSQLTINFDSISKHFYCLKTTKDEIEYEKYIGGEYLHLLDDINQLKL